MVEVSPFEHAWSWFCPWGHRGSGYLTEWEAEQAELGHECYGGES